MNKLEEIKNRLAAATPRPWKWVTHDMAGARWSLEGKGEGILTCAAMLWPEETNAEFIAHAPEDIARLVKALEAVTALHGSTCEQSGANCINEDCQMRICGPCGESHPCPTLTAITEALDS